MKAKAVKKIITSALVVVLAMVPVMGVLAASGGAAAQAVSESTGGTISTLEEVPNTSSVNVAGVATKTTVGGVYTATNLNGTVVATDTATIAAGYGLGANEKAYAKFSNTDVKKSNLAMASLNSAAGALGAVAGPVFNFELGKMSGGRYSRLSSDGAAIRLTVGIPKAFQEAGYTYAVVCVRAGGAITVLQNLSTVDGVITFDTAAGAGTYMIVKVKA